MKNNILDALKGIGKLLGTILVGIGYIPFKIGNLLIEVKFSSEIEAEKKAKELLKLAEPAPKKKRVVKKKQVEIIAKEVNS